MWDYYLIKEAVEDFDNLDGSQKKIVLKMLDKLRENPLPKSRGGYGNPLGNHSATGNLSGLLKLKAKGTGIRIVYKLVESLQHSEVIVIGMRENNDVYSTASKRKK